MKKFAVLLFVQLFFATVVLAQAQIGSFYGLKLGMTVSEVRAALSNQGKTMIDATNVQPGKYYTKDVILGDCKFQLLYLYFTSSKLSKAVFWNSEERDGDAFHPSWEQCVALVSSKIPEYKRIYNEMRLNLINKYGNPNIDNEDETIWRIGSNQLSLLYAFKNDITPSGIMSEVQAKVVVTYKSVSTNVNY